MRLELGEKSFINTRQEPAFTGFGEALAQLDLVID